MTIAFNHPSPSIVTCLALVFGMNTAWAQHPLRTIENAAIEGNRQKLEALIANGVDVSGDTAGRSLSFSAGYGNYETAEILITHGANISFREPENGLTPLHYAVSYARRVPRSPAEAAAKPPMDPAIAQNKKKITALLIARGADVNARSNGGITPLHRASTGEIAELLIKHGANVNAQTNGNGSSPLFSAVIEGESPDVVAVLLAHGADAKYKNHSGKTPLHEAATYNLLRVAEMLIKHGAATDLKDGQSLTPLDWAAGKKNTEMVALLLANGGQFGTMTALHWAASQGDKALAEKLLRDGAQVSSKDRYDQTPLTRAIENNKKDLVSLLIRHGADVNGKNRYEVPTIFSIRDREMLTFLYMNGADPNAKDKNGNTFLWYVGYDPDFTRFLLKQGVNINAKNSGGRTLLHLASRKARDNVVKWLLENGADATARDDWDGQIPLFHAIRSYERHPSLDRPGPLPTTPAGDADNPFPAGSDTSSSQATLKLLLAKGVDLKATDLRGQSPLHVAPTKDAAELLLARGFAVDAKRTDGATPLHLAAVYGRADVVKVLLAHGAEVNAKTKDGVSPLHYAKGTAVLTLLLAGGANVDATDSGGNTPLYMPDEAGVVDLLLAHGATLNAANNSGQTPLLRVVRTYISNLPAHGLMSGPLGDPIVVAHGGSTEVIKALLDHGADVNLPDRDGFTSLFYVRDAIRNSSYGAVLAQLKAVESSLLAHGAKLEKIKKETVPQSQYDFPPELAGIPQIDLGTRVLMQVAITYEERKKSAKVNHLYYREPGSTSTASGDLTFDDHLQLLSYFQSLSTDRQKNGLWIKRMVKQSWTQPDLVRVEDLTQHARSRNVPLYLCEPTAPKDGSWLVTWECEQASPKNVVQTVSCGVTASKGQTPRWECRKREN